MVKVSVTVWHIGFLCYWQLYIVIWINKIIFLRQLHPMKMVRSCWIWVQNRPWPHVKNRWCFISLLHRISIQTLSFFFWIVKSKKLLGLYGNPVKQWNKLERSVDDSWSDITVCSWPRLSNFQSSSLGMASVGL